MAGLFSRLKTWVKGENFKSADLNAELNNIISNIDPTKMSGYSANTSQMRIQTNPGSQGTESLAQTTSDELERLRYVISRLVGGTFWYDTPSLSVSDISTLISQGNLTPPQNRVVSGKTRSTSNQPAFLVAGGSNAKVTLKGASTSFVYRIANVQYTVSSDVDLTFSSFAPSSNNTATVNDSTLTGQASSQIQGEGSSVLTVSSMGSNISALVGSFAAFKVGAEYFIGFVNSSTQITKCFRGFFFDSSSSPLVRVGVNNSDTITLEKLFWVFATAGGALDSTANNPKVSLATPSSPANGDYWFDLSANLWKKYNGSSFVDSTATLIGLAVCNTSNCVASRSFEFYGPYDSKNTMELEVQDNNTVRTSQRGMVANVAGNLITFQKVLSYWIKPDNLDSGVSDGASKTFYLYLKDTGDVSISDVVPYDRAADLQGKYHPYNPWRSLGSVTNDSSSHFSALTSEATSVQHLAISSGVQYSGGNTVNVGVKLTGGTTLTICGADGQDLSPSNPAYFFLNNTLGDNYGINKYKRSSNFTLTFSTDIIGLPWGTTTTRAWGNQKPVYLYATNKNDTDAGLSLFLSGVPFLSVVNPGGDVNYLGYKGNVPTTSSHLNAIFLESSITKSDWPLASCTLIGELSMTKNSSDNWTLLALYPPDGLDGNPSVIRSSPLENWWTLFPSGQNGANASAYIKTAGTAPTWGTNAYSYSISRTGRVFVAGAFTGTCTNGSGGNNISLAIPIPSGAAHGKAVIGVYKATAASTTSGTLVADLAVNPVDLYFTDATNRLKDNSFSGAGDYLHFNFSYQAKAS